MKIKEIMAADVEVLDADASVEEAAQLMSDADVGSVPIVDAGKVIGVVTDRDIVVRAIAEGLVPAETRATDVMTPEAIHCHEDDSVEEAARLMSENQVRRVLVYDREDRLAGIVSLGDLALETGEAEEALEGVSRPSDEAGGGTGTHASGLDPAHIDSLVRGELSAVETYKQAIEKVEGGAAETLRRIEAEHEEAVRLLKERLKRIGRRPPEGSGLWGAWSRAVEGTAKVFGGEAAIRALKEGEEIGAHDYEDALRDAELAPDVKELIRDTLLPQTRAHVPVLESLLK